MIPLSRLALGLAGGLAITAMIRQSRSISFRDRVVLITGGSRGLGLVLARQLGAEGARLVLVARDGDELDRAAVELRAQGVAVQPFVGDVTQSDTAADAVRFTIGVFGKLDVLINNAGIITVGPLENMTEADYEAALATHLWAPLRFMNAALPYLRRTRGRIVNIASIGGKIAVPHLAPYSASKFALAGLSDACRAELAKDGVRVTSVFPGLLRTGSHIQALFKGQRDKEFAWFALGAATPLTSISAERAARQIIRACRRGTPQLIISLQAKLTVLASSLFPNLAARISAVADRALPQVGPKGEAEPGSQARGAFPPQAVTVLADRASRANNEIPDRE